MTEFVFIVILSMSYETNAFIYPTNPPRPGVVYYETAKVFYSEADLQAFLDRYTDDAPLHSGISNVPPEGTIKAVYKAKKLEVKKDWEESSIEEPRIKHDKKLRHIKVVGDDDKPRERRDG